MTLETFPGGWLGREVRVVWGGVAEPERARVKDAPWERSEGLFPDALPKRWGCRTRLGKSRKGRLPDAKPAYQSQPATSSWSNFPYPSRPSRSQHSKSAEPTMATSTCPCNWRTSFPWRRPKPMPRG